MNETFDATGTLVASLIEAMPEPVLVVSKSVRLIAANGAALALFPHLRLSAPLTSSLRAVDLHDAIARVLASSQPESVTWLDRVPVERLFQIHVAAFHAPDAGQVSAKHVALTLHDATNRRELEQMRVDFVANASHELRTPLASLLGFIETLQGPARDDGEARRSCRSCWSRPAAWRAWSTTCCRCRASNRPCMCARARRWISRRWPVTCVDALTPLAQDNRIKLDLEFEPSLVRGDRDELLRVAENLIENAIKYSSPERDEPERTVWINVCPRDGFGVLEVRDEGLGIAPGEHSAPDRTLLPRRRRPEPRQGRHRPRPGPGQACAGAPSRPPRRAL